MQTRDVTARIDDRRQTAHREFIRETCPVAALVAVVAAAAFVHAQQQPPAVRAGHRGDAAQAEPERLADVQPHLRRAALQPAQADHDAQNVGQLREVFKKELPAGAHESIPIVYRGVMYLLLPGNAVQALDATTGALIWEHKRPTGASRAKTIAIYEDMIYQQHARRLHRSARRADRRGALGDEVHRDG